MIRTPARWITTLVTATISVAGHRTRRFSLIFSFSLLVTLLTSLTLSAAANAQLKTFADQHSSLASVLQNLNASRALLYAALEDMGSAAETESARSSLQRQLDMEANMSMENMMAAEHDMAEMAMHTAGPFDQLETLVRSDILDILDSTDAVRATAQLVQTEQYINNINERSFSIIDHGAHFRAKIYEIYADDAVIDKQLAVDEAIQWYSERSGYSVPIIPKTADLALNHRHAHAFARAYPKLSTLNWSGRWIELATIETLMLEYREKQLTDAVDIALARFLSKINVEGHMPALSNSPVPAERPTAPAIAPQLYNAHPEVAIILDNLSMFETVLLDILAYPNLTDRQRLIEAAADEFTNAETNLAETLDYIVSALRGGIYDQGGPASGELSRSERNRSRGNMEMEHDTPKPSSTMRID